MLSRPFYITVADGWVMVAEYPMQRDGIGVNYIGNGIGIVTLVGVDRWAEGPLAVVGTRSDKLWGRQYRRVDREPGSSNTYGWADGTLWQWQLKPGRQPIIVRPALDCITLFYSLHTMRPADSMLHCHSMIVRPEYQMTDRHCG